MPHRLASMTSSVRDMRTEGAEGDDLVVRLQNLLSHPVEPFGPETVIESARCDPRLGHVAAPHQMQGRSAFVEAELVLEIESMAPAAGQVGFRDGPAFTLDI